MAALKTKKEGVKYRTGYESYARQILTLILLTWRIWWAPNNASKRKMGFNSACTGLNAPQRLHVASDGKYRSLSIFLCLVLLLLNGGWTGLNHIHNNRTKWNKIQLMGCMLCRRASVSGRFTGPAVPSTSGSGRSSTCITTKRSIPENATLQHNRYENYRSGVSLSTSKARLGDGKSWDGDQGIWNSNYFSHAHNQVQLNDRYVQHGSCRWVRKRRGHVNISGFPRCADGVFARLGCYAAYVGSCLPTFQGSTSVPSSRDIQSTKNAGNRWKRGYIWGMVRTLPGSHGE